MKRVRFTINAASRRWDGWATGETWNGWDVVRVEPVTVHLLRGIYTVGADEFPHAGADGLVSLVGWTTEVCGGAR